MSRQLSPAGKRFIWIFWALMAVAFLLIRLKENYVEHHDLHPRRMLVDDPVPEAVDGAIDWINRNHGFSLGVAGDVRIFNMLGVVGEDSIAEAMLFNDIDFGDTLRKKAGSPEMILIHRGATYHLRKE